MYKLFQGYFGYFPTNNPDACPKTILDEFFIDSYPKENSSKDLWFYWNIETLWQYESSSDTAGILDRVLTQGKWQFGHKKKVCFT